jgi:GntR family transcriptional regulator / MocR family aminotransferase
MPLSSCYGKPPGKAGLVLGYGGTDVRQIQEGLRKLRTLI